MQKNAQSIELLDFREDLLLKIIDCMTTTEGRGLLLCCRRLSDLARPKVFPKTAEGSAHIISIFWSSGFATIQGLIAFWAQPPPSRRLRGSW